MKHLYNIKTKAAILLLLCFFAISAFSCNGDDDSIPTEQQLTLDVAIANLALGEEILVTPQFQPNVTPTRSYSWKSSTPGIVNVEMNEDYSALVTGKAGGSTTLTFASTDGELEASIEVTVAGPEDDGVLKILAIGNSFSEDAVESYLYDLGLAAGVPMVIGNLYIGGASLDQHWTNAQEGNAVYDYRKIEEDGTKTNTPSTAIATAIADDNWDYISFQQVSGQSGKYDSFVTPLPQLVNYVKNLSTNPNADYILHQTWAYSESSSHSDFPNYNNDQEQMYNSIVDAVRKAQILAGLDYVIPAGSAIQNGRQTLLGQSFTRDGYHLSLNLGRYTAASTWFEALTGQNVVGNTFAPEGLSEIEIEIAQLSAHSAVVNPDKITPLTDYLPAGPEPLTSPVLVNFGHRTVPKWNSLTDHHQGAGIANLKDETEEFTGIGLTVTERFNAMNEAGESNVTTMFEIPDDVATQSYYGNTKGVWQNLEIRQSQIMMTGLDPNTTYNLCFFSSRAGVGDNRETKFIVVGDNSAVIYSNSSSNKTETICADGIQPNSNGEISVTFTAGENNNNGSGFYYVNAMRLAPGE